MLQLITHHCNLNQNRKGNETSAV